MSEMCVLVLIRLGHGMREDIKIGVGSLPDFPLNTFSSRLIS